MVQEWREPLPSCTMHRPASSLHDDGSPRKVAPSESLIGLEWNQAFQDEAGAGLDRFGNPVRLPGFVPFSRQGDKLAQEAA